MVNGLTFSPNTGFSFADNVVESRQRTAAALQQVERADSNFRQAMRVNLDVALRKLQSDANIFNRKLSFSMHKDLNRVVIRVLDSETGAVIRQLPPDQILHMMEEIRKASGVFLDTLS
jgi:flagellar protein FlaG